MKALECTKESVRILHIKTDPVVPDEKYLMLVQCCLAEFDAG